MSDRNYNDIDFNKSTFAITVWLQNARESDDQTKFQAVLHFPTILFMYCICHP